MHANVYCIVCVDPVLEGVLGTRSNGSGDDKSHRWVCVRQHLLERVFCPHICLFPRFFTMLVLVALT